ncbi:MAG: DUF6507 family protein [Propionibacteriaceae bacterium]|jgi:hypothetical protein|nr:DUF6507 family protein [Propionibacteriaceae bacterium]
MTDWTVDVEAVRTVLQNTAAAGQQIGAALGGSADGASPGASQAASDAAVQAQSWLVGTALQGFFDDQQASITAVADRIAAAINSTAGAVTAISQGDQDMAAAIQNKMGQACQSGDFTGLLPGS